MGDRKRDRKRYRKRDRKRDRDLYLEIENMRYREIENMRDREIDIEIGELFFFKTLCLLISG